MSKNDSYCPLMFTHIAVTAQGEYKPCCRFNSDSFSNQEIPRLKDISMQGAFDGSYFSSLREKTLRGEKISGCSQCYQEEAQSIMSKRFKAIRDESKYQKNHINFLEINLGNLCNLKCRMCSADYSTAWIRDWEKLHGTKVEVTQNNVDELLYKSNLSQLKFVRVLGGEPLINRDFLKVLKYLDENANVSEITIELDTNASKLPSEEVLKYFSKYKSVLLAISIDAIEEGFEYIRPGVKWETIEKNVRDFIQLSNERSNFEIEAHATIQTLNILEINKLLIWCNNIGFERVSHSILNHPDYLSLNTLDNIHKRSILERFEGGIDKLSSLIIEKNEELIRDCLSTLIKESSSEKTNLFLEKTKQLDKIRNENFKITFSELNEILSINENRFVNPFRRVINTIRKVTNAIDY